MGEVLQKPIERGGKSDHFIISFDGLVWDMAIFFLLFQMAAQMDFLFSLYEVRGGG